MLVGLSVSIAFEVTIELLSLLVGQVILDVGAAASCKLRIARQGDLNFVRGKLLIQLLAIDHCFDLN